MRTNRKPPKPSHSLMFLVVHGTGAFPIDMLRYDSCAPAREEDSGEIERSHAGHRPSPKPILLARFIQPGVANPATDGRWASFGWDVIEVCADRGDAIEAVRRFESALIATRAALAAQNARA